MPALTMEEFWEQAEHSRKMIERYAQWAFRLTPQGAEDLAGDAIAQAAHYEQKEDSPGFSGKGKLSTYLITVAQHLYFDQTRTREAKSDIRSFDDDEGSTLEISVAPQQHDLVMASVAGEKLRAAIAELSPQRKALLEYLLDDHTSAETAKALGVEIGTFKSTRFRAMADLRKRHSELHDLLPGSVHSRKKRTQAQVSL